MNLSRELKGYDPLIVTWTSDLPILQVAAALPTVAVNKRAGQPFRLDFNTHFASAVRPILRLASGDIPRRFSTTKVSTSRRGAGQQSNPVKWPSAGGDRANEGLSASMNYRAFSCWRRRRVSTDFPLVGLRRLRPVGLRDDEDPSNNF